MFGNKIEVKTPDQLAHMRQAGLVVAAVIDSLRSAVAPGVTTAELNDVAHETIRSRGAASNFLGYHGFTGVICTSVNDEIVHGIPGSRKLVAGDIISVDCGAVVAGWHGDAAVTLPVGEVAPEHAKLMQTAEEALWRGIAAARLGGSVGDISYAIERFTKSQGKYGITKGFTGHGIGTELHQAPEVPNFGRRGRGPKLVDGVVLAIEPMITLGSSDAVILADDWTAVTPDGSWAAHFEHTVAITEAGLSVLTDPDGGEARLAAFDVPFVAFD